MLSSQILSLALLAFGPQHPAVVVNALAQTQPVAPVAAEPGENPGTEPAEPVAPTGPGAESPQDEAGGAQGRSGAPPNEEDEAAFVDGSVATGEEPGPAGEATAATDAKAEELSSDEPAINPRPAGEEALLGKHPVDPSKGTYKPGTGAVIASEDGLFEMGIRARVQIRNEVYVFTETVDDGAGNMVPQQAVENTFGIRRARFQLKGHMFGEHNKYKAEFAFSPNDLGYKNGTITRTPLLSYYVEFDYLRDLSLRLGQYKLYYNRQRVISSGDLEMVDRSLAQGEFNLDRDVGFHFFSKDLLGLGMFKYYAGITVGEGRDIWVAEDFNKRSVAGAQYLARVEFLPFGDFKDYSEVDFERLNQFRLSIAAAYAFLDNGYEKRGYQGNPFDDLGRVDYHNAHADLFFKWAGMTGLVEFYLRDGERDSQIADGDTGNLPLNGIGGSFQLGYLIPRLPIGVAARYSGIGPASFDLGQTALREAHEVGGALSWYIAGHPLKLQADYFHFFGEAVGDSGADMFRVQLQAAY